MSTRIGVIGAGFIGRVHMGTFSRIAGAEVTACTDASDELARAAAAEFAIPHVDAGKHVLCEKPMALNKEATRESLAAERRSGKVAMVAQQMRWLAAIKEAKRLAEAGELGEIYNARCGMMRRKNIPGWGGWFTRMDERSLALETGGHHNGTGCSTWKISPRQ